MDDQKDDPFGLPALRGHHYPPSIALALHEVMSKVGYVQKSSFNDFHKYKYAGEAALLEALRPAMVEAGLLLIPSTRSISEIDQHGNVTVMIAYTLAHKDGSVWPEKLVAVGTGNDRNKNGVGDKGTYKALTGANKYLLFKLFQIETGDDPEKTEGDAPPLAEKNPPGITKFRQEAREFYKELHACEDYDQYVAFVQSAPIKAFMQKAMNEFPRDWDGDGGDVKGIKADMGAFLVGLKQEDERPKA